MVNSLAKTFPLKPFKDLAPYSDKQAFHISQFEVDIGLLAGFILHIPFFTDSSLQASQPGTKTQGVTKKEENRRIEAKESDTSTTRPRYETSFDE